MAANPRLARTPGERFLKARRVAGLDQTDMAEQLGIGRRTITRIENDETMPKRGLAMAWAQVTGVPLEWLETGGTEDIPLSRCTGDLVAA
jgi:transcriptional regulator with XRE-family HTH domain